MSKRFDPIYSRLVATFRERIASGVYRVGEQLPTDAELVVEFRVSRHTVRAALQELVAEGLVERKAGHGTFLKRGGAVDSQWSIGGIEDIIDVGITNRYDVKTVEFVPADRHERIAAILDTPPGGQLLHVAAVRSSAGGAFAHSNLYLSEAIGRRLPQELFPTRPLILLVEEYCSFPPFRTRQVASATAAGPQAAQVLEVSEGSPLLHIERTHLARDGRALQHSIIQYRTDRYQQVTYFSRRDGGRYRPPQERSAAPLAADDKGAKPRGPRALPPERRARLSKAE